MMESESVKERFPRRPEPGGLLAAFACAIIPLLGMAVNGFAAEPPNPLSLEAAKQWADQASPGIMAAAERIRQAEATVLAARSSYYPQLIADAGITHHDREDTDLVGGGGQLDDSFYRSQVGIRIDWLIFDGLSRHFALAAAKIGQAREEASYNDARRLLMQAVAFSFHSALLAQENARIARQDAEFNRELSGETQKRFDAGAASRSEVLNFDIRFARANASLLQAERSLRTARTILAELMGLPLADLPGDMAFVPPGTDLAAVAIPDFATSIERARSSRPDLMAAAAAVEEIEAGIKSAQGAYLPELALQTGYSEQRDRNLAGGPLTGQGTYVGVAGTWNIFDGGARRGRIGQLHAQAGEAHQVKRQLLLAMASEIRQKIDAAKVAREEADLQADIYTMTLTARDLVRSEYNAGKANLTRLNEAQTDLIRADGVLSLARIAFWQAIEELAAATGANLPE